MVRKKGLKDKTAMIAVIITVIGLLGGSYWAIWTERPIVDYNLGTLLPSYTPYSGGLSVPLNIGNRGNIDASLDLILTVTNANITDSNVSWISCTGTQAVIRLAVQSHNSGGVIVHIVPIGNPQSFTISYSVADVSSWSIPNGIIDHVGMEMHPYSPTYATYNLTKENVYELV